MVTIMLRRLATAFALLLVAASLHAQAPAGVMCKDGTRSPSDVIGKGSCSHHGGVDKKATKAATKAADRAAKGGKITYQPRTATPAPAPAPMPMPAPATAARPMPREASPRTTAGAPAGASAQCKDGTYSMSKTRRGTCSHHGGVATWLGLAK